jgi:hypothetical protein
MADLHIAGVCHRELASGASEHKRAVRFFWTVLATASATSIAGNAMHAALNATAVPAAVAAAVATVTGIRRYQSDPNSLAGRQKLQWVLTMVVIARKPTDMP